MAIESLLHFWLEALEPLDLPESGILSNDSSNLKTIIPQKIVNELNPLRYQESPDLSKVKVTSISDIKQNSNDSIRQNFIAWMFSS